MARRERKFNLWVAVSDGLYAAMRSYVRTGDPLDYPDVALLRNVTYSMFRKGHMGRDFDRMTRRFAGYRLLSLYLDDGRRQMVVRSDLSALMAAYYPDDFQVCGAWDYFTGVPIGARVGDSGELEGMVRYPTPAFLTNFLPSGENEDVLLLAGQAPRIFA